MLFGIRRDLQESLVQAGYPVRIYVPYGTHWYPTSCAASPSVPPTSGSCCRTCCVASRAVSWSFASDGASDGDNDGDHDSADYSN